MSRVVTPRRRGPAPAARRALAGIGGAGLLLAAALAGCSDAPSATDAPPTEPALHVLQAAPPGDEEVYFDAIVAGRLVDVGGCAGLDAGEGGPYLVVWPHGTEMSGEVLRTPGGIEARVGDQVDAGGGYGLRPASELDAPAECVAAGGPEVAFVNNDE